VNSPSLLPKTNLSIRIILTNGHIDFDDILRIIDTLSMKRNETVAVVFDEPVNINEYSLFFFSLT